VVGPGGAGRRCCCCCWRRVPAAQATLAPLYFHTSFPYLRTSVDRKRESCAVVNRSALRYSYIPIIYYYIKIKIKIKSENTVCVDTNTREVVSERARCASTCTLRATRLDEGLLPAANFLARRSSLVALRSHSGSSCRRDE
jgi:hypothetical protein